MRLRDDSRGIASADAKKWFGLTTASFNHLFVPAYGLRTVAEEVEIIREFVSDAGWVEVA